MNILTAIQDPYERKARAIPGLILALPLLVSLIAVYGPGNPVLAAIGALLGGSGAIYALASFVRGRGKRLEDCLVSRWGGMPSTIILRYRDSHLDAVTKGRYRAAIEAKLGIKMPTLEFEQVDSEAADEAYVAAGRQLRELTRQGHPLLLRENIAYGFHRNMVGVRWIGIGTCAIGVLVALIYGGVIQVDPLKFEAVALLRLRLQPIIVLAVSLPLLFAWVFHFDEESVRRVAYSYAERLLESLQNLK